MARMWGRDVGGKFPQPVGPIEAATPVPERIAGTVFPYRGQEQHGVAHTAEPFVDGDQWDIDAVDTKPEPAPIDPIPVIIVNVTGNERRTFHTAQVTVGVTPTLVLGRNDKRTSVRIRNLEVVAGPIAYIGNSVNVAAISGWALYPGTELELKTEDVVYCLADGTGSGLVHIAMIYEQVVALS